MLLRLRAAFFVLLGLVFVATWPGSVLRVVDVERSSPSVPKEIVGREGALDVVVRAAEGDNVALAGARVRAFAILDGRAYAAGEAESDTEGIASLRDLPQAEHWIVAEAAGRARASQMVVVVAGARRLELELDVEHTLVVEVRDVGQSPMVGVELEVRGSDPFPVGARTDADGVAHVGRLGEGPYTVTARAPGFEDVTKRRVPEGERLVVVLDKRGALLVAVVGHDGSPAPSSRVLLGSPTLGSTRAAETGKDGTVRIAGLDSGVYALRAVRGAYVSPIELGVEIAKGEERSVRLSLEPGIMITAHVVDGASDDDVRDARVTLVEGGLSPFPADGVTDKRGRVVLGPVSRGLATLSATADDFVPKSAMAIDGAESTEVRIALARGGVLVGKITDARGYAVDGATIRVIGTDLEGMPIDEDPTRWSFREAHFAALSKGPSPLVPAGELGVMPGPVPAIPRGPSLGASLGRVDPGEAVGKGRDPWISGRDGTFRAAPVTPGRVRALVRHPQYVEATSEIVLLESNKEARIDVVLLRGGSLEGRIVDARGRPVEGAHVTALATHGSLEHSTRSASDGAFAFAALPSAVTVLVSRDEDPTTVSARVEVAIPEAGRKAVTIPLPDPRPPLPVKVTDRRGRAIDAAQITALSLDPSETLRVTAFSDPRGRAELAGARGIAVRVEVRAPGYAPRVIAVDAEQKDLVATLAVAERVTGEVRSRRGEPVARAEVTLQLESGVRRAQTNGEGVFSMGELTAGPALVRVRAPGYAPEARDVVIQDRVGDRPTELARFELREEGIVEGVVVDGRGEPIPGARVAKDAVPTYLPASSAPTGMGMVISDSRGRFRLGELGEGVITLEAYAVDVGRARRTDVQVSAGRTTRDVKLVVAGDEPSAKVPIATGGVAVTLGETSAGLEPAEVVVVAVFEGSAAERGGLAIGDVIVSVAGVNVSSIAEARARLTGPVQDDVVVKVRRGDHVVPLRIAREAVRR